MTRHGPSFDGDVVYFRDERGLCPVMADRLHNQVNQAQAGRPVGPSPPGFDRNSRGSQARRGPILPGLKVEMATYQVLVVEDDPALRQLVSEVLRDEGYTVATAKDGLEALRAVQEDRPNLVLLDVQLPLLDGRDVARQMRERGIDSPIVVMTGAANARRYASEIDAEDYLAKPFDLDDVLDVAAEYFLRV